MIGHYAGSALRNFRRKPLNTAIKLLALALGLACLLTAHVIGDYFRQADRQWAKAERTYLVVQEMEQPGGGWDAGPQQRGAPVVAEYLRADFPELESAASARLWARAARACWA
jgi:hypothetical protein